jgi:hypothetical protein
MKYFLIIAVVIVVVELPLILRTSITHLLPSCLFLVVLVGITSTGGIKCSQMVREHSNVSKSKLNFSIES